MKLRRRIAAGVVVVVGVGLFGATGCMGPTEPLEAIIWEGQLESTAASEVPFTGNVAMVAEQQVTRLGLGIDVAPANRTWSWRLFSGTCGSPGDGLVPASAFPPIVTGEDGVVDTEMVIQRRLARSGSYVVQVFGEPGAEGVVKACGALRVLEDPDFAAGPVGALAGRPPGR